MSDFPILVPEQYRAEIKKLSKAELMNIAWDLARRCHDVEHDPLGVMMEMRGAAESVLERRASSPTLVRDKE